jgi:3-methylcrotonyl-CoA carboxylase alpha subunit
VEFLLAEDGTFYFLEMNARLQVEHPVTEIVTGLDLVKLQLRIAAGEPLPVRQEQVQLRGHAIEGRIYAEDPFQDHLPSAGRIVRFEPPQGPGIRNDVGTYAGDVVSLHYDPMLAKLIVYAEDRPAALARMQQALLDYRVQGVRNNLPLLRYVAEHEQFRAGRVHTGFLDQYWPPTASAASEPCPDEVLLAVAAYELGARQRQSAEGGGANPGSSGIRQTPWSLGPWQAGRFGVPLRYVLDSEDTRVAVSAPLVDGEAWCLERDGHVAEATVEWLGDGLLMLQQGSRVARAAVHENPEGWLVEWNARTWRVGRPISPEAARASHATGGGHEARGLSAPMPGKIVRVAVQEGQRVDARQLLLVLEAMKIEHPIFAPFEGTVRSLPHHEGAVVESGALLVELEEA